MKELLNTIIETSSKLQVVKKDILDNFDKWSATETISKKASLIAYAQTLSTLQDLCLKMSTPLNITTIVRDGVYQYGESSWLSVKITAELAFGKPYCSAEEWYKNEKLQALYPDKYKK